MKKIIYAALLLVMIGVPLHAQDAVTIVDYAISTPTSDIKEFIDKTSFRGIGLDIRKYLGGDNKVSVGGRVAWHVFDSGGITETISIRTDELNGDVNGTQFRYINSFPMMGVVHYYFGEPGSVNAYVGAGVGVYYIKQRFEIGLLATEANRWQFGFAPEFGVNIPVGSSIAANFNVTYNYAAASGTDISGEKTGSQYITFNIGLGFYNDIF
jgi:opacity protein-like surface antigen